MVYKMHSTPSLQMVRLLLWQAKLGRTPVHYRLPLSQVYFFTILDGDEALQKQVFDALRTAKVCAFLLLLQSQSSLVSPAVLESILKADTEARQRYIIDLMFSVSTLVYVLNTTGLDVTYENPCGSRVWVGSERFAWIDVGQLGPTYGPSNLGQSGDLNLQVLAW